MEFRCEITFSHWYAISACQHQFRSFVFYFMHFYASPFRTIPKLISTTINGLKKKKFGFGGFHSLKIICIVRTQFTFEIWKLSFSSTRREQKRSQTQFRKFLCVHIFELNLCSLEFDEMLLFSTHTYAHITSLRWKTKQEWRWQSK